MGLAFWLNIPCLNVVIDSIKGKLTSKGGYVYVCMYVANMYINDFLAEEVEYSREGSFK